MPLTVGAKASDLPDWSSSSRGFELRWSKAPGGGFVLEKSAQTPAGAAALRQELALLERLPREGFAQVLEAVADGADGLRVRYRIPFAVRLDDWVARGRRPRPADGLLLCRALARCVAALHRCGHSDRQLSPARFFVPEEAAGGSVCLAELGRLSRPTVEQRRAGAVAWIEGDLAYLAPEQTGRMNRSIDDRCDLYTLGVIFYRILTGRLPFTAEDDLALVHAHLSLPPPAPRALEPDFPLALERLLLKLLEKNAENRYQTAEGLCADLDGLLAHAEGSPAWSEFQPGARDHRNELVVPQRLYGRSGEVRQLLDAFAATAAGDKLLLLVGGYAGVGKSSLISEVHKPITAARGSFVAGKFDQVQRDLPYVAVLGALRELLELVLAEREELVDRWRVRLGKALRGQGGVLLELLPELVQLIGPQLPVPEVEPAEAAARLKRVFQRFISVFARPGHPLVIFLDDLQWADAASLQLLENLFADDQAGHLMVIGAFRDNEIGPGHPLPDSLERIAAQGARLLRLTLAPLAEPTVQQLLADTLLRPTAEVAPLAGTVHDKTEGNPFYLKTLLQSMVSGGALRREQGQRAWSWDPAQVQAQALSGRVVDLVLASLRELPDSAARTLCSAAFLGASFELDDLRCLAEGDEAQLNADLALLEQRRYLLRLQHAHGPVLRFQHDRIQEAAYQLCPAPERAARHAEIGRRLAQGEPALAVSPRLFSVLQHLNHGFAASQGEARLALLRLNLAAGLRAKKSLAYGSAVRALELVAGALDEALWASQRELAFSASLELGHALFLDGQTDRADAAALALLPRAANAFEFAQVQSLRIELLAMGARYPECIAAGRAALAALGVELPSDGLEGHYRALMDGLELLWREV
ncbi:MAG TPA: AAA family ATPase, partial [Ideonella sp.]|nr:AAA family ATPase [Ideonella sp.]